MKEEEGVIPAPWPERSGPSAPVPHASCIEKSKHLHRNHLGGQEGLLVVVVSRRLGRTAA
jgi:hypothetical protein